MGVYHRFGTNDVLHSIIYASPRIRMSSGSRGNSGLGWRGNVGTSSSLSLYGGIRGRDDVRSQDFVDSGISLYPLDDLDTHSIDRVIQVSGSYPATGSVNIVKVRNRPSPSLGSITSQDWYEEHFRPIQILYEQHAKMNPVYFTGSYDYRSLFFYSYNFASSDDDPAMYVNFATTPTTITSSFTFEFQIKPIAIAGVHDYLLTTIHNDTNHRADRNTLISLPNCWSFFITGSTVGGLLGFTDNSTIITGSVPLQLGKWQHVALSVGGGSGSFFVNGLLDSTRQFTGTLLTFDPIGLDSRFLIGADFNQFADDPFCGFSGFMFESRIWDTARTLAQVSASCLTTLFDSGSAHLVHYARFNDGPLSTAHGMAMGSGVFDYSSRGVHGELRSWDRNLPVTPVWQPNDNQNFVTSKTIDPGQIDMFRLIHVPSMFYGRQIATGSVRLTCNAFNSFEVVRTIVDDGRGGLYISGSLTRNISEEEYTGVTWNKVGNVFYTEGLIVITDPTLWDAGNIDNNAWTGELLPNNLYSPDLIQLEFDGVQRIATKVFMCRMDAGTCNASKNKTFSRPDVTDPSGRRRLIVQDEPVTYVSAVGLYDEERNLVAVAKLAQPIRKREKDRLNIKLRMDF